MNDEIFRVKPHSLHRSLAEFYLNDARDFGTRFDLLWESMLHKTGRIKSFTDLLMGVECVLKSHIFMSKQDQDEYVLYKLVRKAGHSVEILADMANWIDDRTIYADLASRLQPFSVFIRYAFDADQTFFPGLIERDQADINYSATIGNNAWVLEIRGLLEQLIDAIIHEFNGFVTDDMADIFRHEEALTAFFKKVNFK